ncbi:MAG: hypothetical protein IJY74_00720, partial [Oscillospiraceae bacterium]|nr:hypothetical protein [Oscillospiraceae bacterium]
TLTIMCWTDDEIQDMYGIAAETTGLPEDKIVYKNVGAGGYFASEQYPQVLASGEDVDIYLCDVDWVKEYENNDSYSAPLSAVGITEDMYANAYDYTIAMGKDDNGVLKGASYKADAGGYCYRTDLAEQYLGITDPAGMQAAISDWDGFWETAEKVHTASGGITAMADSLQGVLRPYLNGTRTLSFAENGVLSTANITSEMEKLVPVFKNAYDAGYISTANPWTPEWYSQGMSAGKCANQTLGYFYSTWNLFEGSQLSQAQGVEGAEGSTYGQYNIVPGPAGWYWGGGIMCVSPKTDNATEAGEFIYAMTVDPDTMKKYADISGNLVNNKKTMDEVVASGSGSNPLLGGQDHFPALMESAEKVNADIMSKYDWDAMTYISVALSDYFEGSITSEDECIGSVIGNLNDASSGNETVIADDKNEPVIAQSGEAYLAVADGQWYTQYWGDDSGLLTYGAVVPEITGNGSYTVGVTSSTEGFQYEVTGDTNGDYKPSGCSFMSVIVKDGTTLYPNMAIEITSIRVNGTEIPMLAKNYTSSDDDVEMRSTIFKKYVTELPVDAHDANGPVTDNTAYSAQIIDVSQIGEWTDIEVDFTVTIN